MSLTIGVGHSSGEGASGGAEAANEAMETLDSAHLVYVFSSYKVADEALLQAVQDTTECEAVVGCSTAAEITGEGPQQETLTVIAVEDDTLDIGIGIGTNLSGNEETVGAEAVEAALDDLAASKDGEPLHLYDLTTAEDGWHTTSGVVFNLFGTMFTGNASDIIRSVQSVVSEQATITGGMAGDDLEMNQTFVYHKDTVISDGIVIIALDSEHVIATGTCHGLQPTDHSFTVTSSDENVVNELDGEPAMTVYEDLYGDKIHSGIYRGMFPLGLTVGPQEFRPRSPLEETADGGLVCPSEVPEGSITYILDAEDCNSLIDAARTKTEEIIRDANASASHVKGALLFDCGGRFLCMKDDETRREEIDAVKSVIGENTPLAGLYTYAEISTPDQLAGVHNMTLALQLFIERD